MQGQRIDRVLLLLLVGSLGFNLYLGARETPLFATQPPYDSTRLAGREAAPLDLISVDGSLNRVEAGQQPTILYVLRPGCDWCVKNTANIGALWEQRQKEYRFVGISLQTAKLREYLAANPIPFDVHVLEDYRAESVMQYGFGATPAMYLIRNGKIERAWGGALMNGSLTDVESFFKVKLPGVPKGPEPL